MGNCISNAPSMFSLAMESSPSLASRSSSGPIWMVSADVLSTTAIGECVNARLSLAVNRKSGFTARALRLHSLPHSGLMWP